MLNADLASFTYSSQPHAAPTKPAAKQARYRDPNDTPLTLMSDPRVVRGSTHSLARKITLSKEELSRSQGLATRRGPPESEQKPQPSYNYTVKPFATDDIDVSRYLIQQTESRPQKKPLETQTDEFIPRPDTPEYVPAKVGVDIGTQVEDVRDLFDFDKEVTPIVEVIVQKTLDQALFELSSEDELKNLEHAARDFRAEKFRGDDWMRTRENQAIRENKQRRERIQALQTARENEKRTKTIIAGVQMMRQTLPHAIEHVYEELFRNGTWQETDNAIAEKEFIPEVLQRANEMIAAHETAQEVLDGEHLHPQCFFLGHTVLIVLLLVLFLADVLLGTEAYYHTFPSYGGPEERRRMVVVLTFRRAPTDGEAAAEDGEGQRAAQNKDVTVMTIQMSAKDSIDSLNRRIRVRLLQ